MIVEHVRVRRRSSKQSENIERPYPIKSNPVPSAARQPSEWIRPSRLTHYGGEARATGEVRQGRGEGIWRGARASSGSRSCRRRFWPRSWRSWTCRPSARFDPHARPSDLALPMSCLSSRASIFWYAMHLTLFHSSFSCLRAASFPACTL